MKKIFSFALTIILLFGFSIQSDAESLRSLPECKPFNDTLSITSPLNEPDDMNALCGGKKILGPVQIRSTGRTAHQIKAEYGFSSKHDLYQITKTKQVVIVE
ncbi:hypothetical protein [Sporosarcina sp. ITBMC105]